MTSVFGNLFVVSILEEAVEAHLREWFPTYLRDVEAKMDMPVGTLLAPNKYTQRNSFDVTLGEDLPLCIVISPGIIGEPITREAGKYTAEWSLGVGIAIAASNEPLADRLAKMYGAAIRGILMQHQDIADYVIRVNYLDENYDDLPIDNQLQYFKSTGVYFGVEVENVVDKFAGPSVPDADPYTEVTTVDEVIVTENYLP
jgi:hypothetical protein